MKKNIQLLPDNNNIKSFLIRKIRNRKLDTLI